MIKRMDEIQEDKKNRYRITTEFPSSYRSRISGDSMDTES